MPKLRKILSVNYTGTDIRADRPLLWEKLRFKKLFICVGYKARKSKCLYNKNRAHARTVQHRRITRMHATRSRGNANVKVPQTMPWLYHLLSHRRRNPLLSISVNKKKYLKVHFTPPWTFRLTWVGCL